MKRYSLVLLSLAFLVSCNTNTATTTPATLVTVAPNQPFNKMLDDYYEAHLHFYPLEATSIGDEHFDDQLPADFTDGFRQQLKDFFNKYLGALATYNRDSLNDNDKISYDVLHYELYTDLEGLQFHDNYFPFNQFEGTPITLAELGSGSGNQNFKTIKNYDNFLARAKAFDAWADSAIVYFKKGIDSNIVLPKTLVAKIIPQLTAMVVTDPTKSIFYGPIKNMPAGFADSAKQRFTAAYKDAIINDVSKSYKKLADFLQKDYMPKARTTDGYGALPNGKQWYAYWIKYWTTTNLTPDSIYNLGLQQVAMLKQQMEAVKDTMGYKGDLQSFFKYLNADRQFFPFKTDSDVIHKFQEIETGALQQVPMYFHKFPKTKFEIRETEKFRAASASAEYYPGSADGSRPGIFYVPILDATKFNITSGMTALFLHEAIPGHHYQVSLQQEDTLLPRFRRFAWYGAYGEGWAHYCETLGYPFGLYKDPVQHIGALGDQMLRAIRLVVDVGLHTGKLTHDEAIKYMTDNNNFSQHNAEEEVERYMAVPGQALCYKIGSLTIISLRDKYQQELGTKFDIAAFHDEFLKDGCLPLTVLINKMDAWAAKQ
jgi:uncharacterized protein (DUF885 family)